jgi:hypothetical protein
MLVNGRFPRADIEAVNALGYLTGEYDQYVDTDDTTEAVDGVKPLPACVRVEANGELAKGWITLDKSHQWYSRCSETALRAAEAKVPGVLAEFPYNARFLDVHTAMGLVECYSKDHPCNRTEDRESKMALLEYVRGLGLVLGGEHGRAWSVKGLDYQEGMMSGNTVFSWPAGWLVKVESADQISDAYLRYGIGYERRVPFWELVFHDCVVSTWYWGDSIGYLDRVRPDLTDRKVAFTALYGTVPLFWATDLDLGFKGTGKERFLEAYRNCAMVHEAVAEQRMRNHRYLSEDRALQETEFADGTRVVVNFAAEPREAELGGRKWTLPSNGIVAAGPTIHEHVAVVDGHTQTSIVRPEWRFHDGHGTLQEAGGIRSDGPVTVQSAGSERLRISLEPRTKTASLDLRKILGRDPGAARLLELGPGLEPVRDLRMERDGDRVTLPCPRAWVAYECLVGVEAERPDAALSAEGTRVDGAPSQGAPFTLRVHMRNVGGGTAQRALVARWGDGAEAASVAVGIAARREVVRALPIDPGMRDGPRTLTLTLEGGEGERIASDNTLRIAVEVAPDWSRWTSRRDATVDLRGVARTDPVAECPLPTEPTADPSSVRVAMLGPNGKPERLLPAQVLPPGVAGDAATLSFILQGEWRGDEPVRVALLGAPPAAGFIAPDGSGLGPYGKSVTRVTYSASFGDGALRPVWFRTAEGAEIDALRQVMFSSPDTGWAEEKGGEIRSLDVLADGPVLTVARIVKVLPTDVTVSRTYSFYPRYVVAEASADKLCVGLFHRVWYSEKGTYTDSAGHTAEADGSGKDEGIAGGCPNPRWFSLRGARWTHVCVALSPFDNQTYWDEGEAIGQCGFTTKLLEGNRVAHVLLGPNEPAGIEEAWQRALTSPPRVEWGH